MIMKKKMLMIYNPSAGTGKFKEHLSDIIELFSTAGYKITIYATRKNSNIIQDVIDFLENDKFDKIVCSGGDGTLNQVISGIIMSGKEPILGYIPAGTTNDFAYNLGVSKNKIQAAKVAIAGEPFKSDIGLLGKRLFTYVAAFGMFTDVSYETVQTTKNLLGRMAYILEGIKRLPSSLKAYEMKLIYGDTKISGEFIFGMVSNSNSVAGFKGLTAKGVLLNDGCFEGVFIRRPKNIMEIQEIINGLLASKLESDLIVSLPVEKLQIVSSEAVPWTVDGEYGGEYKAVEIQVKKEAFTIMRNQK